MSPPGSHRRVDSDESGQQETGPPLPPNYGQPVLPPPSYQPPTQPDYGFGPAYVEPVQPPSRSPSPAYGAAGNGQPLGYGPSPVFGPPSYGPAPTFGPTRYGAPPGYGAPGYGAPGYGAPGYGPPGYGPPGYGPPGYGPPGYGPRYGQFGPPGGGARKLTILLATAAVIVAVVIAIGAILVSENNDKNSASPNGPVANPTSTFGFGAPLSTDTPAAPGGQAGGVPTDIPSPTGTAAPIDGPTIADSQATANRYFADLNAQNKTDAISLICDEGKSEYQQSLAGPDNDFSYSYSHIVYQQAGAVGDDITVLTYSITVTQAADSEVASVKLYFVAEDGAKLCGEG